MNNTEKQHVLITVEDGETFELAGIEFIKFPDMDGMTPVVAKDVLFSSRFGKNNDLRQSEVLKKLEKDVLPKIVEAIGKENLCTIRTDLTTLDGLKPYGSMESLISLPTFDFYRQNITIFDRYNPGTWWWLATPDTAQPHYDPVWVVCVSPRGFYGNLYGSHGGIGVRPFLILKSTIFGSYEE